MKKWLALVLMVLAGVAVVLGPRLVSDRPDATARLTVFCAAGLKKPVEEAALAFERETGVAVALQYGGTGTLLSQLAIARAGDLFIAADEGALGDARRRDLVREVFPLVRQTPVIAVREGNPLGIRAIDDLARPDVRTALANPEAASIGRVVKTTLGERWHHLAEKAAVMKPTVTEIATDLSLGAVDAAIVWDAIVPQFPGLESIPVPEFEAKPENASACVITSCAQPRLALRLARYLTAAEKGSVIFSKHGFTPIKGDAFVAEPELLIYSGSVNRLALEPLLKQFADREGVRINTVYNGCGVLCASLKTLAQSGGHSLPDAYYACDLCFVPPVADVFPEVTVLTETEIVIAVPKGNPRGITALADLAQPGLKLGISNQSQATLGFMTAALLRSSGHEPDIRKNVAVEVPTADFLINQMRVGGLDAAIVYRVNVLPQAEHLDSIPLPRGTGRAVQPFSVRKDSPQSRTAARLLTFLQSNRAGFEAAGFVWRGGEPSRQSREIQIPEWLKQ
jgi:molybdate transport system substrate-binding protein